jgi:cystathionine beta-lyase/cystathionine gamma-synthase
VAERGNGAMVTVELKEGADMSRFFASLGWIKIVPSLAGVETSVSYPLGTSHRSLTEAEQDKLGINERVVRISVGIEDAADIISQLGAALESSACQS